jgi:hypothetical protein
MGAGEFSFSTIQERCQRRSLPFANSCSPSQLVKSMPRSRMLRMRSCLTLLRFYLISPILTHPIFPGFRRSSCTSQAAILVLLHFLALHTFARCDARRAHVQISQVGAFVAGPLVNYLGVKTSFIIGCVGYSPYAASFYVNLHTGNKCVFVVFFHLESGLTSFSTSLHLILLHQSFQLVCHLWLRPAWLERFHALDGKRSSLPRLCVVLLSFRTNVAG